MTAQNYGRIHVCSLDDMPGLVTRVNASHVVSLINRDAMPETPPSIDGDNHLKLAMNDIDGPMLGLKQPSAWHVERLIEFLENWERNAPLVIHCWAGISRSTAAAMIAFCHLNPSICEDEIVAMVRRRSPTATPNRMLIRTADKLMGRSGRLTEAVEKRGYGEIAPRGVPFSACADLALDGGDEADEEWNGGQRGAL